MSLYYRIKVPLYEWSDRRHFYHDPTFKALDQELLSGPNPYPISHVFPYGETPFHTLTHIAKAIDLKPTDHFIDLGCGRGRAVFFLSHFFGCQATGIDLTPSFIARAKHLAKTHNLNNVSFHCQDFLTYNFTHAACIYLYGTTYSDETLLKLEERLLSLPRGSRIITVSAPLMHIQPTQTLKVSYPWGKAEVFIHLIK